MTKALKDFYILCDCIGDDLNIVAELIHKHHHIKDKLSRIKDDIEEGGEERIEKYHPTIILLLDKPMRYLTNYKNNKTSSLFD